MKYLDEVPRELPKDGRVIVHNRTHPQWADQYPGHSGFRVWTAGKSRVKRTPKGKGPLQPAIVVGAVCRITALMLKKANRGTMANRRASKAN